MYTTEKALQGKKVILFGASSGIGLATAKAVADTGGIPTIISSSQTRIDQALQQLPDTSQGHVVDCSSETAIRTFFQSIGPFDHLVYTAGENISLSAIDSTDLEQAQKFFQIRFWGAWSVVKYGAHLISKGGSINLMSGSASVRPGSGWTVAAAICGSMDAFVRALAVELAPIRVNCVAPGLVKSPLWNSMQEQDRQGLFEYVEKQSLVRRLATPEDIAQGLLYLMTQKNISGQSLLIDGGMSLV